MALQDKQAPGRRARHSQDAPQRPRPEQSQSGPVDVVDGIPDRSARRPLWAYVVLALIFLGWIAFLVTCRIVGSP